ncbi:flagellin [Noviherbaspirillum aerium]|uniref:flagellin n=1 Tax=Noviherbaspirillum aerium TaxID=2588497 RepID=UPI00124F5FFA|nr:flagellin [Noviherbaspirillum aerium]
MASYINTNVASLNSQRALSSSQGALQTSLQRLSSGLRINSAKDDAAGLAISDRMTSQIRGMNQAARNANDGISLAQTAEGALGEIGNNLQRIRELAVQSANATNSASDRAALQAEVTQLASEITRVGSQTQFNGLNLLDGSFADQDFQVGANSGQTIKVASISDARSTGLGRHNLVAESGAGATAITGKVVSGAATNGVTAMTAADAFTISTDAGTTAAITYAGDASAKDIAAAINTAGTGIGVTAQASNSVELSDLSAAGAVTFDLNGKSISATVTDTSDLTSLVAAINGSNSGVTATFTDNGKKDSITLKNADGDDIVIENFAHAAGAASDETIKFGGTTLDEAADVDAVKVGTIELNSSKGRITTANASEEIFETAGTNTSSFESVSLIDISSAKGAQDALKVIDAAMSSINSTRADLGAVQNRFTSVIANLQTTSENMSGARSRIMDADFAAETASMTRSQILQQAGTAMLAQANSLPNGVLSLLRG